MTNAGATGDAALAAGRDWLATLPRAAVAHAARGARPLAAVEQLLHALGDPHERLQVVHIAGSKGKGSTALYIEALLLACGRRTFTFTSPHLERWTERLRIDGHEAEAGQALEALKAVQRAQRETGITPGFFEALTVAGLWLAAKCETDWAVIEAGVGGRADATNVVRPRAGVITGIELEHIDRLGPTLEAIAREKAGIVKPGMPLLAPALPPALDAILAGAVDHAGSDFLRLRRHGGRKRSAGAGETGWHFDGRTLSTGGPGWSVRTPFTVAGDHMAANAALALATVARLGITSREGLQQAARGLGEQVLPGRMEILSKLPWVMVDGAHTAASAAALATAVNAMAPARLTLLLSLTAGKDIDAVCAPLLPLATRVIATRADPTHSLSAETLAQALRQHHRGRAIDIESMESPADAISAATVAADDETLILATGSVYLAGVTRALFRTGDSADRPI